MNDPVSPPILEEEPTLPRSQAGPDQELVMFLERDQFVADTSVPVPPAALGWRARAGLWALRVFVIVISAMVIATFIAELR